MYIILKRNIQSFISQWFDVGTMFDLADAHNNSTLAISFPAYSLSPWWPLLKFSFLVPLHLAHNPLCSSTGNQIWWSWWLHYVIFIYFISTFDLTLRQFDVQVCTNVIIKMRWDSILFEKQVIKIFHYLKY